MITSPGDVFFPYNAISVLENASMSYIDPELNFERRRLEVYDANDTVGIAPVSWDPVDYEIGKIEPAIQLYSIYIQTLIVDPEQDRGLQTHSWFAKQMREMLVRYKPLHIALGSLQTTDPNGVTEKTLKFSTGSQVFHDQESEGHWRYLSTLELRLETQINN